MFLGERLISLLIYFSSAGEGSNYFQILDSVQD
jgi:hypothetical protein